MNKGKAQQTVWHVRRKRVPKAPDMCIQIVDGWVWQLPCFWQMQIVGPDCFLDRQPANQAARQPANRPTGQQPSTNIQIECWARKTSINGLHLAFAYLTPALSVRQFVPSTVVKLYNLSKWSGQAEMRRWGVLGPRTPLNGGFFCEFQYILNGLCRKRITTLVPQAYHYG